MVAFLAALATSLVLSGFAIPVLRRAQFMDVPNHRSSHTRPVPRGGGVAVVSAVLLVAVVTVDLEPAVVGLLLVTLLLALVGLVDDLISLPSGLRFGAQVMAAAALSLLLLVGSEISWWWLPILVVAIAGYVNAFNFMDGVNGISALTAAVVGCWWAWAGVEQGHDVLVALGAILAGAALGFLPWNAPRAHVFLGDVGSYGLGVFIAGLSALALSLGVHWGWVLAPLVVYGADTGWVLVKRFRGGRSLTEAHREHVYQRLVDAGWNHVASALLCAGAAAVICVTVGAAGTGTIALPIAVTVVVVLLYVNSPRVVRAKEARG